MSQPSPQHVSVVDCDGVRHVVIDRPEKRNALSVAVYDELSAALSAASADASVLCVVVRGAGEVFSAGNDVRDLRGLAERPGSVAELRPRVLAAMDVLERMPKPTIAQVHGLCLGGAMQLALAADFRILADTALVGALETSLGLLPDLGGCSRLAAVVGLGVAKELVMTARLIDAAEAERVGFANRVAPAEHLDHATAAFIGELQLASTPALGLAKRILDHAAKPALALTLEQECAAQTVLAHGSRFQQMSAALVDRLAGAAPVTSGVAS